MRTLFIGNSHTFYNDMPNIFKEICKENGIDMQVAMLTKGGMGFDYHAENEQTRLITISSMTTEIHMVFIPMIPDITPPNPAPIANINIAGLCIGKDFIPHIICIRIL